MESGIRALLRFFASSLLAGVLAFGAIILMKNTFFPIVENELPPVISEFSKEKIELSEIRDVRERVFPAVFPVRHRSFEVSASVARPISLALGLTSDGYLLTTLPIPNDAVFVLPNYPPLSAVEIHKDETLGLAIIKVEATRIPVARFAKDAIIEPGTPVHVLTSTTIEDATLAGNKFIDERRAVEANALGRRLQVPSFFALPGSPVAYGDTVLGVIVDEKRHLALPANVFTPMINRFLKTQKISHPSLGIDIENQEFGALIKRVKRGSEAEKAGLKVNDMIPSVEGERVQKTRYLSEIIEGFEPNETVLVRVKRGEDELSFKVPLSEMVKK